MRRFEPAVALFVLGMFTASFEIFLALDFGFKFKFCYFSFLLSMCLALAKSVSLRRHWAPLGFGWAVLWSLFIAVFSLLYRFEFLRNIGYALWLFFNLGMVYACVQIFCTQERVLRLVRLYILSFAFVASFGAVQFVIALAGLPAPLHVPTAWWTPSVPRINAFSYEPSYFALYLLPGWIILAYCIEKNLAIVSAKKDKLIFALITVTSVLSASRAEWLMILLYALKFPLQFARGFSFRKMILAFFAAAAVATAAAFWLQVSGGEYLTSMLLGEDASPKLRMMALQDTLDIFWQSPFFGYGLGGVSSAIAEIRGYTKSAVDSELSFSGMSISLEALAASGLIGIAPFILYVWTLMRKPFVLARRLDDPAMGILLRAVALSFIFTFIKLQFNQNILRPYFWLNIAVLSAVYAVALRGDSKRC